MSIEIWVLILTGIAAVTVIGIMQVNIGKYKDNAPEKRAIQQTIEAKFGHFKAVVVKRTIAGKVVVEYVWVLLDIAWASNQLKDSEPAFNPIYCMYLRYPEGRKILKTIISNWDTASWVATNCEEQIKKLRVNHVDCVIVHLTNDAFNKIKQNGAR